jgi:hypothetical protein
VTEGIVQGRNKSPKADCNRRDFIRAAKGVSAGSNYGELVREG